MVFRFVCLFLHCRINIKEDSLEYFTSRKDADSTLNEAKGKINMENLQSVRAFDDRSFQLEAGPDRVYLLKAESKHEADRWVNSLLQFIREKRVRDTK